MIASAIMLLVVTCATRASAACDARQVAGRVAHVTISLFSASPNPAWKLTEAQTAELCARLARLRGPSPREGASLQRTIGYGGLYIDLPHNAPGIWMDQQLIVYGGLVMAFPQAWADPARELELWLLETAEERISDGLKASVLAVIRKVQ